MNSRTKTLVCGLSALGLVLGPAGCAALPSSGSPKVARTQSVNQGQLDTQIRMTSKAPTPEMSPVEIVDNFRDATNGDDQDPDFTIAKLYLAKDHRSSWTGTHGAYILDTVTPTLERVDDPGSGDKTYKLNVGASLVGEIDSNGFYRPRSGDAPPLEVTVHEVKDDPDPNADGWRIISAPQERVISLADFVRISQPLPVYRPGLPGPTENSNLILDQAYITQSPDVDRTYAALIRAALGGRAYYDYAPPSRLLTVGLADMKEPVQPGTAANSIVVHLSGRPRADEDTAVRDAIKRTLEAANATLQAGATPTITSAVPAYPDGSTDKAIGLDTRSAPLGSDTPGSPLVYMIDHDSGVVKWFNPPDPSLAASPQPVAAQPVAGFEKTTGVIAGAAKESSGSSGADQKTGGPTSGATVAVAFKGGRVQVGVVGQPEASHQDFTVPGEVTNLAWDPADGSLWIVADGQVVRAAAVPASAAPGKDAASHLVTAPQPVRVNSYTASDGSSPRSDPTGSASGTPQPAASGTSGPGRGTAAPNVASPAALAPSSDTNGSADPSPSQPPPAVGTICAVRFSPDGQRVVIISRGSASTVPGCSGSAWMASIDRVVAPAVPSSLDPRFQLETPKNTLQRVYDAAWIGNRTVVLLASDKIDANGFNELYADGSQDAQLAAAHASASATATVIAAVGDDARTSVQIFSDGTQPSQVPTIFWKLQQIEPLALPPAFAPFVATEIRDKRQ